MSSANWFSTEKKAFDLRTLVLTNESTYTAKTNAVAFMNGVIDRVIEVVTTASGNDLVIIVPNGAFPGQQLLIILKTLGDNETVTITTTTGDDSAMSSAGDFVALEWIDSSVSGWQQVHSQVD